MAYPTFVNNQTTDAVTQSNVTTLGESAAIATSNLYQAASSALANAVQNATFGQQQTNTVHQAATAQGVNLIYAVDTEAVADATEKVARADIPADVINMLFIPGIGYACFKEITGSIFPCVVKKRKDNGRSE